MSTPSAFLIKEAEEWVKRMLKDDKTGHDFGHIQRVRKNARQIYENECQHGAPGTTIFLVDLIALFHEMTDGKLTLFKSEFEALNEIRQFLKKHGRPNHEITEVLETIPYISYSKSVLTDKDLQHRAGQIAQDADFLEALGPIGIYRVIAYSNSVGRPFYDPTIPWRTATPDNYRHCPSALHHINEKLLTLLDHFNTQSGRTLAIPLHRYVKQFLNQSLQQWETGNIT